MTSPAADVRRTVLVRAPAQAVWGLVTDLPGMGRFSPENTGGRWVSGEGPALGAVFRGRNARGRRRWGTRCEVVVCEPPRAFAFDVSSLGLPVARWRFDVEPVEDGCRVTESWSDHRSALVRVAGRLLTGVADREGFTAVSIERTLEALRAAAEADVTPAR